MENPNYYRGIILHAYDADIVIFMIPAGDETTIFPPSFGNSLNREVIGVVSKVDMGKDVEAPRRNLKLAGATISVHDQESLDRLCDYIYS